MLPIAGLDPVFKSPVIVIPNLIANYIFPLLDKKDKVLFYHELLKTVPDFTQISVASELPQDFV